MLSMTSSSSDVAAVAGMAHDPRQAKRLGRHEALLAYYSLTRWLAMRIYDCTGHQLLKLELSGAPRHENNANGYPAVHV